jgi:hypothetical protein
MPEYGGWSPDVIHAEVGEPLHLKLTSDDVVHGFAVGQMDMQSVDILPGKVTTGHAHLRQAWDLHLLLHALVRTQSLADARDDRSGWRFGYHPRRGITRTLFLLPSTFPSTSTLTRRTTRRASPPNPPLPFEANNSSVDYQLLITNLQNTTALIHPTKPSPILPPPPSQNHNAGTWSLISGSPTPRPNHLPAESNSTLKTAPRVTAKAAQETASLPTISHRRAKPPCNP